MYKFSFHQHLLVLERQLFFHRPEQYKLSDFHLPIRERLYYSTIYQTKAGKAHDFNRGMIGRTLELLWEKFQNNSFFVYIHVFVTTWHLKYDIIDT